MFNDENFEVTPVCSNCKHANLYIPYWTYPWGDPKCEISMNNIEPDDSCGDFELIGRNSR